MSKQDLDSEDELAGYLDTFDDAPQVVPLLGPDNSEVWEASLRANLAFHGLDDSLEPTSHAPPHSPRAVRAQWEDGRKVAKAIVKASVEPVMWAMRSQAGWHERDRHPRAHFAAALNYVARAAAESGLVADLTLRLCRSDRLDCDSLAAYQRLLTDTRRRLTHLQSSPGDAFLLWVAINGLRGSNPRWHRQLVEQMAAGALDWNGLMASMAAKACREHPGKGWSRRRGGKAGKEKSKQKSKVVPATY